MADNMPAFEIPNVLWVGWQKGGTLLANPPRRQLRTVVYSDVRERK